MLALQLPPGSSNEGRPVSWLTRRNLQHDQVSSRGAVRRLVVPRRNAPAPVAQVARTRANAGGRRRVRQSAPRFRLLVFADRKERMGLLVRTIGLDATRTRIGLANLAYNFQRIVFHEHRAAVA